MKFAIATVTITHKNCFKQIKGRKNRGIQGEMSKDVKVKNRKARKIKRKYEITLIDKISIINEKLEQKIQLKASCIQRYEKRTKFLRHNKIFQDNPKYSIEI